MLVSPTQQPRYQTVYQFEEDHRVPYLGRQTRSIYPWPPTCTHSIAQLALSVTSMPNDNCTERAGDPREEMLTLQVQSIEDMEMVVLPENRPDWHVKISITLTATLRDDFIQFLQDHSKVFAWSYDDMPNISPVVIFHKLNISLTYKLVHQKQRSYNAERYEAMKTEVDKLRSIGFIVKATYPVWLANSVMV